MLVGGLSKVNGDSMRNSMRPPGLTSTFAAVNAAIMGPAPAVKSGEPPVAAPSPEFALFLTTAEVFAPSASCFWTDCWNQCRAAGR